MEIYKKFFESLMTNLERSFEMADPTWQLQVANFVIRLWKCITLYVFLITNNGLIQDIQDTLSFHFKYALMAKIFRILALQDRNNISPANNVRVSIMEYR